VIDPNRPGGSDELFLPSGAPGGRALPEKSVFQQSASVAN